MIDYQSENVEDAIKKITEGKLIDIWIDTVSKESVEQGKIHSAKFIQLLFRPSNADSVLPSQQNTTSIILSLNLFFYLFFFINKTTAGLKNLAYGAELALIVDNANYDNKLF